MGRLPHVILLYSLAALAGCGSPASAPQSEVDHVRRPPQQSSTAPLLRIGSVSLRPKQEIEKFQPLARYLAEQLRPHGVSGCEVVVADSTDEMAELMEKGEVDVYVDSPYPVVRVGELCGAVPILRRWKKHQETYHGVVFARRNSGIADVEDLKGHVIAFEEEFSTAGHVLPKGTLRRLGLTLVEVDDASRRMPPDRVGYVFSHDDESTLFWVSRGKVAAGATNNAAFDRLTRGRPGEFVVLVRTAPVPRHVLCHRAALDPALVATLKGVLLAMPDHEMGRKVLAEFEKTTKFDEFPQGADVALAPIRDFESPAADGIKNYVAPISP